MAEYRNRMAANQLAGEENYYYLTIDSNRMIDAGPKVEDFLKIVEHFVYS